MGLALLQGCAPFANMRPITPLLPDQDVELGMAYTTSSPRPVGRDAWAHGVQGWSTIQPLTWLDVSLVGHFDGEYGSAGLGVRFRPIELERFVGGLGFEVGYGWLAAELPFAVGAGDRVWLYSSPQIGSWGHDPTVRVPIGVSVEVVDRIMLRGEGQVNYPDFDPYKRRFHLGFGVAYQL